MNSNQLVNFLTFNFVTILFKLTTQEVLEVMESNSTDLGDIEAPTHGSLGLDLVSDAKIVDYLDYFGKGSPNVENNESSGWMSSSAKSAFIQETDTLAIPSPENVRTTVWATTTMPLIKITRTTPIFTQNNSIVDAQNLQEVKENTATANVPLRTDPVEISTSTNNGNIELSTTPYHPFLEALGRSRTSTPNPGFKTENSYAEKTIAVTQNVSETKTNQQIYTPVTPESAFVAKRMQNQLIVDQLEAEKERQTEEDIDLFHATILPLSSFELDSKLPTDASKLKIDDTTFQDPEKDVTSGAKRYTESEVKNLASEKSRNAASQSQATKPPELAKNNHFRRNLENQQPTKLAKNDVNSSAILSAQSETTPLNEGNSSAEIISNKTKSSQLQTDYIEYFEINLKRKSGNESFKNKTAPRILAVCILVFGLGFALVLALLQMKTNISEKRDRRNYNGLLKRKENSNFEVRINHSNNRESIQMSLIS